MGLSLMLEPYGFIAMLLGLVMAVYTTREYRRGRLGLVAFLTWSIIWLGLVATGIFPRIYLTVTSVLGMATPIQFVTTFSVIALFAIVYQFYRLIGEINRKITKIVQHAALRQSGKMLNSQQHSRITNSAAGL